MKKILLIDDYAINIIALKRILKDTEFEVINNNQENIVDRLDNFVITKEIQKEIAKNLINKYINDFDILLVDLCLRDDEEDNIFNKKTSLLSIELINENIDLLNNKTIIFKTGAWINLDKKDKIKDFNCDYSILRIPKNDYKCQECLYPESACDEKFDNCSGKYCFLKQLNK